MDADAPVLNDTGHLTLLLESLSERQLSDLRTAVRREELRRLGVKYPTRT